MATVSLVIEADDTGVELAAQKINTAVRSIEPAWQMADRAMGGATANPRSGLKAAGNASGAATGGGVSDFPRGREAAMLFREETGVNIPRALQRVAAQSALIGPILQSAFGTLALIGFIEVGARLAVKIEEIVVSMFTWRDAAEQMAKANVALTFNTEDQATKLQALANAYRLFGLEGSANFRMETQNLTADLHRQQQGADT